MDKNLAELKSDPVESEIKSRGVMANNMNQFVEIRKSIKHGNGLFALKDFKKGERLYLLEKGRVVNYNEIQDLSE